MIIPCLFLNNCIAVLRLIIVWKKYERYLLFDKQTITKICFFKETLLGEFFFTITFLLA